MVERMIGKGSLILNNNAEPIGVVQAINQLADEVTLEIDRAYPGAPVYSLTVNRSSLTALPSGRFVLDDACIPAPGDEPIDTVTSLPPADSDFWPKDRVPRTLSSSVAFVIGSCLGYHLKRLGSLTIDNVDDLLESFDTYLFNDEEVVLSESELEKSLQKRGLTHPRVTPAMLDNAITSTRYIVDEASSTTVCFMETKSGYTVVGHSSCVDPRNFDSGIGRQLAFEHARQQLWPLEGYRLASELNKS